MKFNVISITLEQKIVTVYSLAGFVCGMVSNYLNTFSLTLALLLPMAVYLVTLLPLIKFVKERKLRMLISNSLITFFLVWLMVWVFLHNL